MKPSMFPGLHFGYGVGLGCDVLLGTNAGVRNLSLGEGCPVQGDDPPSFKEATTKIEKVHPHCGHLP